MVSGNPRLLRWRAIIQIETVSDSTVKPSKKCLKQSPGDVFHKHEVKSTDQVAFHGSFSQELNSLSSHPFDWVSGAAKSPTVKFSAP
jgi:hypothetical protein